MLEFVFEKEEGSPVRQHQTSQGQIISKESIPRTPENIPFMFEGPVGPVMIDCFKGSVAAFRLYLIAQRKLLEAGVLAP